MRLHPLANRITSLVRPSKFVAGFTVGAIALGGVGLAFGAVPGTNGVINACYRKVGGYVRIIDTATSANCNRDEKSLAWNQTGPQGPQGATGATGAAGPQGPAGASPAPDTSATPNTQIVAHLSGNIIGGPGQVDVYGYALNINLAAVGTFNANTVLRVLVRPEDATPEMHNLLATHIQTANLSLLSPDGTKVVDISLGGAGIVSFDSTGSLEQYAIQFATATIGGFVRDFPAPSELPIGTIHPTVQATAPVSGLAFGGNGPQGSAYLNIGGRLNVRWGDFITSLLRGPLPTSLPIDRLAVDGSVTETLTFGQLAPQSLTLSNNGAANDLVPAVFINNRVGSITTSVGTQTTCWSYVNNTAC